MIFKLITFDFTGTLMRFRLPPSVQYESVARMYGIEIREKDAFRNNFKRAFQIIEKEHANFGAATNLPWTQWWLKVVKLTFTSAGVPDTPRLDAVAWHLIKLYSTTQGWEVMPGVEEALHQLKAKGQKMGVISNMDTRLGTVLQQAGLHRHFDFALSSYEAGCAKPDPRIFTLALEKCGRTAIEPSDCLHVGDTYKTDYVGAVEAGWRAVLINRVSDASVCQCSSISELNCLLDNL